ncbi:MAG: hypothetical protein ACKOYM_06340, partial [Actinomycetes bacterium]
ARSVAGLITGLRAELLVGVAVLTVTAVLVGTRPPVDAVVRPFAGQSRAGAVTVRIEVTPAAAGPNDVHVFFTNRAGLPLPIDAFELKVSSSGIAPRRVPVQVITASHSVASGVQLTSGTWRFRFVVVRAGVPSSTTIEVPIR